MAERRPRRLTFQVHLDYTFDRLRGSKLAQVYELLVPTQQRLVGARVREGVHEVGGDLRSSVLGSAARGTTSWRFRRSGSSKTKAIAARRSSGRALNAYETLPPKARCRSSLPTRPIG